MHAYLIVGSTPKSREEYATDFLQKSEIKEIHKVYPEKEKHSIKVIREITKQLQISPLDPEKGRALIIYDAHNLTNEAANAFLKTLENPPGNTMILLTAPDKDLVLDTISSRAMLLNTGTKGFEYETKDKDVAIASFSKLIEASVGQKLKFLEKIEDREDAIKFCDLQIYAAREKLLQSKDARLVYLIEKIEKAKEDIWANVNVKLTIGDLLLNYKL